MLNEQCPLKPFFKVVKAPLRQSVFGSLLRLHMNRSLQWLWKSDDQGCIWIQRIPKKNIIHPKNTIYLTHKIRFLARATIFFDIYHVFSPKLNAPQELRTVIAQETGASRTWDWMWTTYLIVVSMSEESNIRKINALKACLMPSQSQLLVLVLKMQLERQQLVAAMRRHN